MRIGIDCRFWNETGVGRYTRHLVYGLKKIDKKNEYVLFVREKDYVSLRKELKSLGWDVVKTSITWHTLEEQLYYSQIIAKEHVDLMHFPYFSVPIFYKKPFVITIHDLILHHFSTGKASTLSPLLYRLKLLGYRYILKSAAKRAEKIITVSHATEKEIVRHLGVSKDKIAVTYEGADLEIPASRGERNDFFKNSHVPIENYFLHVGNVYPHKNVDVLLQAFKKFKKEDNLHTKLVFAGRKDYFQELLVKKAQVKDMVDDIIFLEHVTDSDLQSLYERAIALVSSSLMEGFGLPVLEAMSSECLVLASNIEAYREICAGAALYFDPRSADSIANVLQFASIHDKKSFAKNIAIGKDRSMLFSWEKMAKETRTLYESCISLRQGKQMGRS